MELTHLGIICDGNRRWARARNLPTLEGHTKGFDKVELIINALKDTEVKFVSFYLFSTENWDRSEEEIAYLMRLVKNKITNLTKKALKENLKIVIMGKPEPVEPNLWAKMLSAEEQTQQNTGLTVCICFNYGGRWEIAEAAQKMSAANEQEFTPETFAKYIYHPEVPDCDMIVRTSGEQRISGFQLWRAAYAEFYFMEKHFPDFEPEDVAEIIDIFHHRQRRFGK